MGDYSEDIKNKIMNKYKFIDFSEFDFDRAIVEAESNADDMYFTLENMVKTYARGLLNQGNYNILTNMFLDFNVLTSDIDECFDKIFELDMFFSDIGYEADNFSYVGMLKSCNKLKSVIDKIKNDLSLIEFDNKTFSKLLAGSEMIDEEEKYSGEVYNSFCFDLDDEGLKLIFSSENVKKPPITLDEELRYFEKIRSGDENSRLEFLERNYKLILYFANKVKKNTSLSLMDLFQEGYFGLSEAVDNFDPSKGFRFSTYAGYWIKAKIGRAISKYNQVKVPVNARIMLDKYRREEEKMKTDLKRKPRPDEVMESIGVNPQKMYAVYNALCNVKSLNASLSNDNESEWNCDEVLSLIADPNNFIVEELETDLNRAIIDDIIKKSLNDRQLKIVKLRFGFDGSEPLSLRAIGDLFGTSKQNIDAVLKNALKKLATGPDALFLAECSEYPDGAKRMIKQLKEKRNK